MFRSDDLTHHVRCRPVELLGHSLPAGRSLSQVDPCRVPSCVDLVASDAPQVRRTYGLEGVYQGVSQQESFVFMAVNIERLGRLRRRSALLPRLGHKAADLRHDLGALALRALHVTLLPLREGHDQFEGLVALLAHELITRHGTSLVLSSP